MFMNRNKMASKGFSFKKYDCIGFDLDNCLVEYDIQRMSTLIYGILCRYLVNEKGYNKSLLKEFNFDFLQKGLFLDFKNGNIVKLNSDGKVIIAYHGTKKVENIGAVYGKSCIWDLGKKYASNPLSAWNGPLSEEIRCLLDSFDMPCALVFARIVDTNPESYCAVWKDILSGLYYMYDYGGFSANSGEYFPALKNDPNSFIKPLPTETIQWIKSLRQENKFVYLLTGSASDFASFTSHYALGCPLSELFDLVIFYAKKPAFFVENRPFIDYTTQNPCQLTECTAISQGCWTELKQFVCTRLGKSDMKAIYVGDNLIQDVFAPVASECCDAVAICDDGYSPVWGSYKFESGELSLWQSILSRFASVTAPTVSSLIQYS